MHGGAILQALPSEYGSLLKTLKDALGEESSVCRDPVRCGHRWLRLCPKLFPCCCCEVKQVLGRGGSREAAPGAFPSPLGYSLGSCGAPGLGYMQVSVLEQPGEGQVDLSQHRRHTQGSQPLAWLLGVATGGRSTAAGGLQAQPGLSWAPGEVCCLLLLTSLPVDLRRPQAPASAAGFRGE